MNIIIPYFSVMIIAGFISMRIRNATSDDLGPYNESRKQYTSQIIAILVILTIFAGFRRIQAPAIDETIYRRRMDSFKNDSLIQIVSGNFAFLGNLVFWLGIKIYHSSQGGILFSSLLNAILLLSAFKRDCKDFSFAIILYFATGSFFSSFNGISQTLAAMVFLYGFKYIYDKKFWQYALIVLIATLIHTASIILLVVYFIANLPVFSKKVVFIDIALAIIMILGYRNLSFFISRFGILTDYYGLETSGHHGVNYLTILISIAPTIIAFLISGFIPENDRITNATINVLAIDSIIMLVSAIDVYIARLSLFTGVFSIIFLSRMSLYLEERNNLLKPIIVILYVIVFIIRYYSGVLYYFSF